MKYGLHSIRSGEVWVDRDGSIEQAMSRLGRSRRRVSDAAQRLEEEREAAGEDVGLRSRPCCSATGKLRLQRVRNVHRDVGQDVRQSRAEDIRPQGLVASRIDELCSDPHAIVRIANAALHHGADAKLGGDFGNGEVGACVARDRRPRDHVDVIELRELREHFLMDASCEIGVIGLEDSSS